jgi:hypothetical protein
MMIFLALACLSVGCFIFPSPSLSRLNGAVTGTVAVAIAVAMLVVFVSLQGICLLPQVPFSPSSHFHSYNLDNHFLPCMYGRILPLFLVDFFLYYDFRSPPYILFFSLLDFPFSTLYWFDSL